MVLLTVEKFYREAGGRLGLKVVAGRRGLTREITTPYIQKAGLSLTGMSEGSSERVCVLGRREMRYLSDLPEDVLEVRLGSLFSSTIPCCIVTWNQDIPPTMLLLADARGAPLFRTTFGGDEFMPALSCYFEEAFSQSGTVHGVLVEVFGVGVLIIGASGVGKSELALDLVARGHSLVGDDVVDIVRSGEQTLVGSGSQLIKHHMEIRGLGIINVRELFGISAVREQHPLNLVVELVDWDQRKEYDRLGLDERYHTLLEVALPMVQIPVSPGRNLTTIVEVAVRNQLLKAHGTNSVEALHRRLSWALNAETALDEDDEDE